VGSSFERALWLIRRHAPEVREDGFALMREIAAEHVAELMAAFESESEYGLRCWLLALLGETRAVETVPMFSALLYDEEERFRELAAVGLQMVGTKEARTALYRARANGLFLPTIPPPDPRSC
jgi:HEAT repeat protein